MFMSPPVKKANGRINHVFRGHLSIGCDVNCSVFMDANERMTTPMKTARINVWNTVKKVLAIWLLRMERIDNRSYGSISDTSPGSCPSGLTAEQAQAIYFE